ncbi:chemotaxis protein CheW [Botryobacter ruber]|uniref:chemotaxis protein CheW n=1 Tax=Botryobacter ruber TaxID=2171629 RepID=UPI000E0AAB00|nr:chemotaxis protein CheW [Botryobacter ruber]
MNKGKPDETATEQPKETVATQKEAAPKTNGASEQTIHLVVFKLGTEEYAIKIEQVKEVTVTPSITQMPRTPSFIKGVANIRGDIIAIMDLEERFRLRPAVNDGDVLGNTYTLVIEAKDYSIGVVVKEVPQSLNLPVSKIDKAPSFLQDINIHENYIEGIAKIGERLIIVLDMFKILTVDEIKQLTGQQK